MEGKPGVADFGHARRLRSHLLTEHRRRSIRSDGLESPDDVARTPTTPAPADEPRLIRTTSQQQHYFRFTQQTIPRQQHALELFPSSLNWTIDNHPLLRCPLPDPWPRYARTHCAHILLCMSKRTNVDIRKDGSACLVRESGTAARTPKIDRYSTTGAPLVAACTCTPLKTSSTSVIRRDYYYGSKRLASSAAFAAAVQNVGKTGRGTRGDRSAVGR